MKTIRLLNTRPTHQAKKLTAFIEKQGGDVFHLPVLDFEPVLFAPLHRKAFDYFIFLSANAVNYFFAQHSPRDFSNSQWIAIGPATQQALYKMVCKEIICPDCFSTAGILELSFLKNIQNKSIAIVSGENSKYSLPETLKQRSAILPNLSCYRRKKIEYNMDIIFPSLLEKKINSVISTSYESFLALLELFKKQSHHQWLINQTICVVTDQLNHDAVALGFKYVIQAKNATDVEIFNAFL